MLGYFIHIRQGFNACQSEFIKYTDSNLILTPKSIVFILCVKMRNPRADPRFPGPFVILFLIYLQVLCQLNDFAYQFNVMIKHYLESE